VRARLEARRERLEKAREEEEKKRARGVENLRRYRTPAQACPRGCGFSELARRDVAFEPVRRGQAEAVASFTFETTNCPKCGAGLVSECGRCEQEILAPVVDLCRSCGLPQPWAAERRAGTDRATIRLWRPEKKKKKGKKKTKSLVNEPAKLLYSSRKKKKKKKKNGKPRTKSRGDLWVIDGDIAQLAVDAVVSNDDVHGQMWAQSARAIKQAAGDGVERLAQEGKPFELGHAWVTTAGNLQKMKGIIHVASTSRYGKSTIKTAGECLAAALRLAAEAEYRSIGVTAFGTGPAGIEREDWFEMFAETAVDFLSGASRPKGMKVPLSVVLVLLEPPRFKQEVEELRQAVYKAWLKRDKPGDGTPEWKPTLIPNPSGDGACTADPVLGPGLAEQPVD
jgi:O-acetyl-ADP-ribose deacetylase (regulator of RNase III)